MKLNHKESTLLFFIIHNENCFQYEKNPRPIIVGFYNDMKGGVIYNGNIEIPFYVKFIIRGENIFLLFYHILSPLMTKFRIAHKTCAGIVFNVRSPCGTLGYYIDIIRIQ